MLEFTELTEAEMKVVSAVSRIEATSAIRRLQRDGLLDWDEATSVLGALAEELVTYVVQPIDHLVLGAAEEMTGRHPLRALDAIQLASAMIARSRVSGSDVRFISSDLKLLHAARGEDFEVWDPTA